MEIAFTTDRLIAEACWDPDATDQVLRLYSDERVTRFLGMQPITTEDGARAHLELVLDRTSRWAQPMGCFPLRQQAGGDVIGIGLLKHLPTVVNGESVPTDDIEVGWHLRPDVWGQGLATEVGRALLARGFEGLDVDCLHAVVEPPNTRSKAVALRLGMQHQGQVDRYYGVVLEHYLASRPS